MSTIAVQRSNYDPESVFIIEFRDTGNATLRIPVAKLDELKKVIEEFQNPMFEKGDIVKLTGKSWSTIGKLRNTLQVIIATNAFEYDEDEYETYKNEFEDFSATLVGKAV